MPTLQAALLASPAAHSLSPRLHAALLRFYGNHGTYEALDVPPEGLGATLDHWRQRGGTVGLNLSSPHKVAALPHLASLSEEAARIGAVNTLERTDAGWVGHNTDAAGFGASFEAEGPALILGSGGAACAAAHALADREVWLLARNESTAEPLRRDFALQKGPIPWRELNAVINATSARGELTFELGQLSPAALLYDMQYRHGARTSFLAQMSARFPENPQQDGLEMLCQQAFWAHQIWMGTLDRRPEALAAMRSAL